MDGLCSAFQKMAATCEGGTMMQGLQAGPREATKEFGKMGQGRAAGARTVGVAAQSRQNWATPYARDTNMQNVDAGMAAAMNTISNVNYTVPEVCGCPPPTRENIFAGFVQTAKERNRWDDAPIEEVRTRVCDMARLGTEDNQMCVPWRICPRNTEHLPVTRTEGEQYDADFVIIAPSPQRYYEGETIVFTPKVAVQPTACLLSVITTLECKFKACWEMAHLVSLTGADKEQRVRYSSNLLSCLARARNVPDETPWAIIRPFKRPPNTIAPPVSEHTIDLLMNPGGQPPSDQGNEDAKIQTALNNVLGTNGVQGEDSSVDLLNANDTTQLPPQEGAPLFQPFAARPLPDVFQGTANAAETPLPESSEMQL